MNMMSMKMLVVFAGMGAFGYMYMKKHPEVMKMMKEMLNTGKEEIKKIEE